MSSNKTELDIWWYWRTVALSFEDTLLSCLVALVSYDYCCAKYALLQFESFYGDYIAQILQSMVSKYVHLMRLTLLNIQLLDAGCYTKSWPFLTAKITHLSSKQNKKINLTQFTIERSIFFVFICLWCYFYFFFFLSSFVLVE